jgi:hypothetical protein
MTTTRKARRIIRLAATLAALAGLVLIATAYLSGNTCPPGAAALIGGALIAHWLISPRYSNGRAA